MIPQRRLWQSVIYQAFMDATGNEPGYSGGIKAKRDADSWIRRGGRSFRDVCSLAGMDPDFLSEAYKNNRVNRDVMKSPVEYYQRLEQKK